MLLLFTLVLFLLLSFKNNNQAMGIRRYIFMSIFNCDKHPEVPLMNIKAATEQFLASNPAALPYTVLRLCGFHQVRMYEL